MSVRDRDSFWQQTKSTCKTYDKITNCRYCRVGSPLYTTLQHSSQRMDSIQWNNNKLAIALQTSVRRHFSMVNTWLFLPLSLFLFLFCFYNVCLGLVKYLCIRNVKITNLRLLYEFYFYSKLVKMAIVGVDSHSHTIYVQVNVCFTSAAWREYICEGYLMRKRCYLLYNIIRSRIKSLCAVK